MKNTCHVVKKVVKLSHKMLKLWRDIKLQPRIGCVNLLSRLGRNERLPKEDAITLDRRTIVRAASPIQIIKKKKLFSCEEEVDGNIKTQPIIPLIYHNT